jgi:phosphatidate phosphatase APP1
MKLSSVYHKFPDPFKFLKVVLKKKLGWLGVPMILPYMAYGNEEKLIITGAVIEDKGLSKPTSKQSLWSNMLAMIKRYSGDELAGVKVKIAYNGIEKTVQTNEKGIFHTIIPNSSGYSPEKEWQTIRYTLADQIIEDQGLIEAIGDLQIINPQASYIVVSDIDDTVLVSHSTSFFRKLRLMLFKNAMTRMPLAGVPFFYRALVESDQQGSKPIFYVSASEWNLYDLLTDFFEYQELPKGPLMLSEYKTKLFRLWRSGNKAQHKQSVITQLFERFYDRSFILIGDSGQKDPEIYLRILEMFPTRVKAIYIRYTGRKKKNKRLVRLTEESESLGAEMVIVHSTDEAVGHAVKKGFIAGDVQLS